MRFQVKKGIPVKINFRALGEVGCGNGLIYSVDAENSLNLILEPVTEMKVLEYTPQVSGEFQFQCTTNCYRGVVTVTE
jgi:plastocyanin domain-containing protein